MLSPHTAPGSDDQLLPPAKYLRADDPMNKGYNDPTDPYAPWVDDDLLWLNREGNGKMRRVDEHWHQIRGWHHGHVGVPKRSPLSGDHPANHPLHFMEHRHVVHYRLDGA